MADRSVTVRVPAKINLDLRVGPRRADGYHELSTTFHAVGLYDDVTLTPADDWSVTVTGPYAHLVPTGEDNLVVKAGRALAVAAGGGPACAIHIAKDIPVAGGMAGGSADAAATLRGLAELWGVRDDAVLHEVAAGLGSDLNFALVGGTAIGSGRGEQVAPILGRGTYHWVLVPSDEGLSTPTVFAELDRQRDGLDVPAPAPSPALAQALRSGDPHALAAALTNDLQPAAVALQPRLAEVLDAGLEYGALGGLVSGSGPTVAFLVDGAEGALDLAVALTASGVARDVKRAAGPVPGATVTAR